MNIATAFLSLGVALLCSASPAVGSTAGSTTPVGVPNSCIERNHGDAVACNVGNSGRGDQAYRLPSWCPVRATAPEVHR